MSKRGKRSPQPPRGRAKPIGPVLGLARAEQAIEEPVKENLRYEETPEGNMRVVASKLWMDRTKFSSRLLAIAGGGIKLESIGDDLTLSPAQRKPVSYSPTGDIDFRDPRQVLALEQWEAMQDPGTLLVISGSLVRMSTVPGNPTKFDFQPNVWDVAEPQHHAAGKLALPPDAL